MPYSNLWQKASLYVLLIAIFLSIECNATHIRAGEITAKRVEGPSLTYRFSIVGYTDTGSGVNFGGGEMDFGDGTVINIEAGADFFTRLDIIDAEKQTAVNVFEIEHTFQAPGSYLIRFYEKNRNAGVLNMANSVDTPFYVETRIRIDPFLGVNNTPTFLIPPMDEGVVGIRFIHNPGAFDVDGDSLSFKLVTPQQSKDQAVLDYASPNHPKFYGTEFPIGNEAQNGPPKFEINNTTGDLVWDAPGTMGEYNVALVVEEWRKVSGKWYNLGYVMRDLQIIIEDSDNERPEVLVPDPVCIEAGETFSEIITATDKDGHQVKIRAYGGPFTFENNTATFPDAQRYAEQPLNMTLGWQPSIDHVREKPYHLFFIAEDNPPLGPHLTDIKSFDIKVKAPSPGGFSLEILDERKVRLDWNEYDFMRAEKMLVWRKIKDSVETIDDCSINTPFNSGFELVAEVDSINYRDLNGIQQFRTTYIDNNLEQGLSGGVEYCYVLQVKFEKPKGGSSFLSEELCVSLPATTPMILNVDVLNTSKEEGEIYLKWTDPLDTDVDEHPAPYSYEVTRTEDFAGRVNPTITVNTDKKEFLDKQLNTKDNIYHYTVRMIDKNGKHISSSTSSSSIRLNQTAKKDRINLYWEANTSWGLRLNESAYHYIYRNHSDPTNPDKMILIDSVNVFTNGLKYTDVGSFNNSPLVEGTEYTYYVETHGGYGNQSFPQLLINKSQKVRAVLNPESEILSVPETRKQEISVYPNPSTNILHIQGLEFSEYYVIYDQLGKTVINPSVSKSIDISHLQPGIYILKSSKGRITKLLKR